MVGEFLFWEMGKANSPEFGNELASDPLRAPWAGPRVRCRRGRRGPGLSRPLVDESGIDSDCLNPNAAAAFCRRYPEVITTLSRSAQIAPFECAGTR